MNEEFKKEGEAAASAERGFLDKVKDKLEDLKDKAEDVWDKVEDKAEDLWDKVEDKAEEVWDAAKEKGGNLKDKIIDTFDGDNVKPTEEKK
jgi:ElaB/YqjD/DUF883 family membrane-anchored ribosome-binding protein